LLVVIAPASVKKAKSLPLLSYVYVILCTPNVTVLCIKNSECTEYGLPQVHGVANSGKS